MQTTVNTEKELTPPTFLKYLSNESLADTLKRRIELYGGLMEFLTRLDAKRDTEESKREIAKLSKRIKFWKKEAQKDVLYMEECINLLTTSHAK